LGIDNVPATTASTNTTAAGTRTSAAAKRNHLVLIFLSLISLNGAHYRRVPRQRQPLRTRSSTPRNTISFADAPRARLP
jgi:hypothetical protein